MRSKCGFLRVQLLVHVYFSNIFLRFHLEFECDHRCGNKRFKQCQSVINGNDEEEWAPKVSVQGMMPHHFNFYVDLLFSQLICEKDCEAFKSVWEECFKDVEV